MIFQGIPSLEAVDGFKFPLFHTMIERNKEQEYCFPCANCIQFLITVEYFKNR